MAKIQQVSVYSWRARDPRRWRGWRELTFKMTKEAAAEWAKQAKAEIQVIDGSEEVRAPIGGGY